MIKVKYQLKQFPNTVLFKFFKTEEQIEIFKSQNRHYRFEWFMDLPINDEELNTIVSAMSLGGDTALYQKLKLIKELKDQGLPYKKILREEYGMVVWWKIF